MQDGNPFSNILGGSSSIPTKANELGPIAALPAPQPSDLDEQGSLPQKSPGEEIKLPEQPKPEPPAPEQLGKVRTVTFLDGRPFYQTYMGGKGLTDKAMRLAQKLSKKLRDC
jgi:hypothetical protein